jgi:uncharacterized repeat protein (TIGR01451 family)
MSVRVLPILLSILLVAAGSIEAQSSDPIPPGFSIPLSSSVTPSLENFPEGNQPAVASPARIYPAVAESVPRSRSHRSTLRWVRPNEPSQASEPETAIQPLPDNDAEPHPEVDVLPTPEPWEVPAPTPAPALRSDAPLIEPSIPVDLSDAPQPSAAISGTGIVQAAPTVVVEIAGPPRTSVGATASFVIYVKNMGSVTADGVVVQAMLPEYVDLMESHPVANLMKKRTLVFGLGDLEPQAVRKINLDLRPRSTGEVRLHTSVGFSVAASSTVQVSKPKLSLKCDAPGVAALGDLVTFELVIENTGDVTSDGVVVIPQVAEVGQSEMSEVGRFDVGTLAPGVSKEILLRAMANRAGSMQIQFLATDDSGEQVTTQTRVRVRSTTTDATQEMRQNALMDVTFVVPAETRLGVEQDYEIRVSNPEPSPARNVHVTCTLPADVRLTVIERDVQFSQDFATMTWQVGEMASGATEVLRFKARVGRAGEHTLRAVLESDRLSAPRTTEATIGVEDEPRHQRTASL